MPTNATSKKRSADDIVTRLQTVQDLVTQGVAIAEAVRTAHITEITFYRWRKAYGGLTQQQVARLLRLQDANGRLRRRVRELGLDKLVLKEVSRDLLITPEQRRSWIDHVIVTLGVSERRACQILGQHRSTQRKKPKLPRRSAPQPSIAYQ